MMFMPTIGIPRGHRKRAHPTGLGGSDGATGTGPTAAIHIRITLFDQARELKLAGVRAAFQQRQDTVPTYGASSGSRYPAHSALHAERKRWIQEYRAVLDLTRAATEGWIARLVSQ